MSENIISSADAEDLLRKLETEHIRILACFAAEQGWQVAINGFVRSLTEGGLLISGDDDKEHPSFLDLPVDAKCAFGFADKRELPEDRREQLAESTGEAALSISLPGGRLINFRQFLTLHFKHCYWLHLS